MTQARRSPLRLVLILAVALAVLAAAGGLAYLFLRGAPPPPVSLGSPSPGASSPAATTPPGASGGTSTSAPGGLDGTWTIDPSIGSFSDFSSSYVGYRVDETFTNQQANTAVGRTPNVTGTLTLEGSTITAVDVTADMTSLRSDDSRRDGQLGRQAIQTDRFPTATFRLTGPIELGDVPADGETISATATGDLTLHGVTRSVQVPIQAQLAGDVVTVIGSIEIQFADYGIEQPTSFIVLSIEDHGIMELQLHFRRG